MRVLGNNLVEMRARNCKDFDRHHSNRICGSRIVVQEGHVAKEITPAKCSQVVASTAFQLKDNSNDAFADEKQFIPGITHSKDRFACFIGTCLRATSK